MATKGGGGKALVTGPLKRTFLRLPLRLLTTLYSDRLTGKKVNKNKWNIIGYKQTNHITENAFCNYYTINGSFSRKCVFQQMFTQIRIRP